MTDYEALDFLNRRLDELESYTRIAHPSSKAYLELIACQREVIEIARIWPILVQGPIEPTVLSDYDPQDINSFTMGLSKKMAYMETQEYIKKFGTQPPVAPFIRKWLEGYRAYPDFKEEWIK